MVVFHNYLLSAHRFPRDYSSRNVRGSAKHNIYIYIYFFFHLRCEMMLNGLCKVIIAALER